MMAGRRVNMPGVPVAPAPASGMVDNNQHKRLRTSDMPLKFYNSDIPDFGEYLLSEKFTDVYLICQDQKIAAHRARLSSVSPLLASIFATDTSEVSVVIVPDVNYEALRLLIHFIYTGFMRATSSEVQEILEAGHVLGIDKAIDVEQDNFRQRTRKRPAVDKGLKNTQNKKRRPSKLQDQSTVVIVEGGDNMAFEQVDQPPKYPIDLHTSIVHFSSENEQAGQAQNTRQRQQTNLGEKIKHPQVNQEPTVVLLENDKTRASPASTKTTSTLVSLEMHTSVEKNCSVVREVVNIDQESSEPQLPTPSLSSSTKVLNSTALNLPSELQSRQAGPRSSSESSSSFMSCQEEIQNKEEVLNKNQEKNKRLIKLSLSKNVGQGKVQTLTKKSSVSPPQTSSQNVTVQNQTKSPQIQEKERKLSSPQNLKSSMPEQEKNLAASSVDSMNLSRQETPSSNFGVKSIQLSEAESSGLKPTIVQTSPTVVSKPSAKEIPDPLQERPLRKETSELTASPIPLPVVTKLMDMLKKTSAITKQPAVGTSGDKQTVQKPVLVLVPPSKLMGTAQQTSPMKHPSVFLTVQKLPSPAVGTSEVQQTVQKPLVSPVPASKLMGKPLVSPVQSSKLMGPEQQTSPMKVASGLKLTVQKLPSMTQPPAVGTSGVQQTVQKPMLILVSPSKLMGTTQQTSPRKQPAILRRTVQKLPSMTQPPAVGTSGIQQTVQKPLITILPASKLIGTVQQTSPMKDTSGLKLTVQEPPSKTRSPVVETSHTAQKTLMEHTAQEPSSTLHPTVTKPRLRIVEASKLMDPVHQETSPTAQKPPSTLSPESEDTPVLKPQVRVVESSKLMQQTVGLGQTSTPQALTMTGPYQLPPLIMPPELSHMVQASNPLPPWKMATTFHPTSPQTTSGLIQTDQIPTNPPRPIVPFKTTSTLQPPRQSSPLKEKEGFSLRLEKEALLAERTPKLKDPLQQTILPLMEMSIQRQVLPTQPVKVTLPSSNPLLQETPLQMPPSSPSPAVEGTPVQTPPSGLMRTVQQALAGLKMWKTAQMKCSEPVTSSSPQETSGARSSPQPYSEEEKQQIEAAIAQKLQNIEKEKEAKNQNK